MNPLYTYEPTAKLSVPLFMKPLLLIFLLVLWYDQSRGQTVTEKIYICSTKFNPHSVTYNGSDNPNECWESVAWGILIDTDKVKGFFSLGYQEIEKLKTIIGDNEIEVQVAYYDEWLESSGEIGHVKSIKMSGEIIYPFH